MDLDVSLDNVIPLHGGGSPVVESTPWYRKLVEAGLPAKGRPRVLALDVSKLSTGLAILDGGEVFTRVSKTSISFKHSLDIGRRMIELESDIMDFCHLHGGIDFDIIVVEEALIGVNAKTTGPAYVLNYIIDRLLVTGNLTTSHFFRVGNSVWKKYVSQLTGSVRPKIGSQPDKRMVLDACQRLGFPLAFTRDDYKSWTAYLNSGVQDQLDAFSMLLWSLAEVSGNKPAKPLKTKVSIYFDESEAQSNALHPLIVEEVAVSSLSRGVSELSHRVSEPSSYACVVSSLGRFGVSKKFFKESPTGQYVVLVDLVRP